jgi:hypothetical protein
MGIPHWRQSRIYDRSFETEYKEEDISTVAKTNFMGKIFVHSAFFAIPTLIEQKFHLAHLVFGGKLARLFTSASKPHRSIIINIPRLGGWYIGTLITRKIEPLVEYATELLRQNRVCIEHSR